MLFHQKRIAKTQVRKCFHINVEGQKLHMLAPTYINCS